jgi:hypothetical protein
VNVYVSEDQEPAPAPTPYATYDAVKLAFASTYALPCFVADGTPELGTVKTVAKLTLWTTEVVFTVMVGVEVGMMHTGAVV